MASNAEHVDVLRELRSKVRWACEMYARENDDAKVAHHRARELALDAAIAALAPAAAGEDDARDAARWRLARRLISAHEIDRAALEIANGSRMDTEAANAMVDAAIDAARLQPPHGKGGEG